MNHRNNTGRTWYTSGGVIIERWQPGGFYYILKVGTRLTRFESLEAAKSCGKVAQ